MNESMGLLGQLTSNSPSGLLGQSGNPLQGLLSRLFPYMNGGGTPSQPGNPAQPPSSPPSSQPPPTQAPPPSMTAVQQQLMNAYSPQVAALLSGSWRPGAPAANPAPQPTPQLPPPQPQPQNLLTNILGGLFPNLAGQQAPQLPQPPGQPSAFTSGGQNMPGTGGPLPPPMGQESMPSSPFNGGIGQQPPPGAVGQPPGGFHGGNGFFGLFGGGPPPNPAQRLIDNNIFPLNAVRG